MSGWNPPQHERRIVKRALICGMVLCASAFLFAGTCVSIQLYKYGEASGSYASLAEYGPGEFQSPIDFSALRRINPQVVAWVQIPDTPIDYPVAQADDNQRYLEVTFDGKYNNSGAIFMDFACQKDLMGKHTIIYGHNMRVGTMFAHLNRFKDAEFLKEHKTITLYTPERTMNLRVLGAYPARASYAQRETNFDQPGAFTEFVQNILDRCGVDYVGASDIERLYTFATCSYEWDNTRTWVHAIEWEETYEK